jgi:hypothetical protein
LPPNPNEDEAAASIESSTYSGNVTYSENDTYIINKTYIENATHGESDMLENAICSENTTCENATYSENDTHGNNTANLAKLLGFTALGAFAVLLDEFPSGSGMLNVTQLSKSCGVARTTLIKQIRILEKCGTVSLGAAEKQGRWIEIMCSKNATCSENDIGPCSSSSLKTKNNYYRDYSVNATCSENAMLEDETCVGNDTYSKNNIYSNNDMYSENDIVAEKLSKSKITMRIAARELYFIAKASSVNIDRLSNQCFKHFLSLKQSKGSNYAMALFLSLLSKSRENPTAYVIRAIQQGAAPSREDQRMAGIISEAGETVFKKVGEEILQRDLDAALSRISLSGVPQDQIQEELDVFTDRISE